MTFLNKHRKLAIAAAVLLLFFLWRSWDGHFTPQRWADTDVSHRGKMVHSLLEQYDGLVGMTAEEVVALLGADNPGNQVEELFTPEGSLKYPTLCYPAGGRPWAMFPEYLILTFEDDVVVQAKLVAD